MDRPPASARPGEPASISAGSISAGDTACFEAQRSRLCGVAYRMLGSVSDADDIVQDGWLRWFGLGDAGRRAVTNPAGWMTTAVTRLALDRLKSAAHRRETYVGPWLPDPIVDADPERTVELAESLTLGFLTMLERLGPVERAVFLLVDVFDEPYTTVAEIVGRSEVACRQVASRARRRLREDRSSATIPSGVVGAPAAADTASHGSRGSRSAQDQAHADTLVDAFLGACIAGDLHALHVLLAHDAVVLSDGGGLIRAAARPVVGADRAARFLVNVTSKLPADGHAERCTVNGEPGLLLSLHGQVTGVIAFGVGSEQIHSVNIILNPEKLSHLLPGGPGHLSDASSPSAGTDRDRT